VTGRDVPDGDMPNLPWPKHRDEPVTGDPSLADVLTWAEFPPGSAPELKPVAEVLAALTAGPADDELAGEGVALAAYRNRGDVPRPATRGRRRRRPLFPFLSARAAATVAAAAVLGIGVFATAAYTQALPAPVQRLAHVIIGAPTARAGPATGPFPAGSGASGPGATGPDGGTGRAGGTPTGRAHPSPALDATTQSAPPGSGEPSTQPTPQDSGTPTPTPIKSKGKPSSHPTKGNGNGNGNGNGKGNGKGNGDSTPTPQP
jgi:hypothetical protein